jgi:aspartyl-tRNA(Asn)/glutamyl-tRNA(Gln) amidotransferase subunit B
LPTARSARPARRHHRLIKSGTISGKIAKDLFEIVWTEGGDPAQIVEDRGMKQVTDTGAIEAAPSTRSSPPTRTRSKQAKANPKLLGWFVGQVMKATGGKANPQAVFQARQPLGPDVQEAFDKLVAAGFTDHLPPSVRSLVDR